MASTSRLDGTCLFLEMEMETVETMEMDRGVLSLDPPDPITMMRGSLTFPASTPVVQGHQHPLAPCLR